MKLYKTIVLKAVPKITGNRTVLYLIKFQAGLRLYKKQLRRRCFTANFEKLFRKASYRNTSEQLSLYVILFHLSADEVTKELPSNFIFSM